MPFVLWTRVGSRNHVLDGIQIVRAMRPNNNPEALGQSIPPPGHVLYGIAIRILIRDPDRHQNLIICSLAHCRLSLTISGKSVREFLSKVANRQQTDKQTNNDEKITSLAEVTMSRAAVSGQFVTRLHDRVACRLVS